MNIKEQVVKLKALKVEFAKKQALLEKAKRLHEQVSATGLSKLLENDLEQAKLILAAKDVCDKLQKIAEHLAELGAEEIMPLSDAMKGAFGPNAAATFEHAANSNIQKALETVRSAKDSINSAILQVEGKIAPQNDMNAEEPSGDISSDMSLGNDEPQDANVQGDPFGGAPANSGPEDEPLGRARKESRMYSNAVLESGEHDMNEGKSFKYDTDDDDDAVDNRKKAKDKRDATRRKYASQTKNLKADEALNLTLCGEKLLERETFDNLFDWVLSEASNKLSLNEYQSFVKNATLRAISNPTAMAGWIGKKKYGMNAMLRLSESTEHVKARLIAEAIAQMIETNAKIFGKGRAAKVVEAFLGDNLMEDEKVSVIDVFESIYGMKPAQYSIHVARKIKEDDDDLTPQDATTVGNAIGQIATKMATNSALANQPANTITTQMDPNSRTALQKVAGDNPTMNVAQLVKTASDKLDKDKHGVAEARGRQAEVMAQIRAMGLSVKKDEAGDYVVNYKGAKPGEGHYTDDLDDALGTARIMAKKLKTNEAAFSTDAGKHRANSNHPSQTSSAKSHPMTASHKGIPLNQMVHNQGEYGENTDGVPSTSKGVGRSHAAPLKGTNAKNTIAPRRDSMTKSTVRPVTKEEIEEAKRGNKGEHVDDDIKHVGKPKKLKGTNAKKTIATEELIALGESKLHKHHKHKHPSYVMGVGGYYAGLPRTLIVQGYGGCDPQHGCAGWDAANAHDSGDSGSAPSGDAGGASAGVGENIEENINAANWPTDTMGQYKGEPMSTDYGKHKASLNGGKDDYKSTGANAKPDNGKNTGDNAPANTKGTKDTLAQLKGSDNQSNGKVASVKGTNAKDTVKRAVDVPESFISYEDEILEAEKKKGKIPPQFVKKVHKDEDEDKVKSPKPHAQTGTKKAKAKDREKAVN